MPGIEPPGGEPKVAVIESPIVNGEILHAEYSGVVMLEKLDGSGFCSGALYTNNIVVTAKHCIVSGGGDFRNRPQDVYARMGGQRVRGAAVRVPTPEQPINLDDDVGLLKLESGMTVRNAAGQLVSSGYRRPEYTGTAEALDGKTLRCLGYGLSTHDQTTPLDGNLRSATVVANYVAAGQQESPGQRLRTDESSGGIQSHGDSGGPCLDGSTSLDSPIAAITSTGDFCSLSIGWNDAWPEYGSWINATYPTM